MPRKQRTDIGHNALMLSYQDVAAYLGVGDTEYVSFLVDAGHLKSVTYRSMRLVYRRDVDAFAERCFRNGHMPERITTSARSAKKQKAAAPAKRARVLDIPASLFVLQGSGPIKGIPPRAKQTSTMQQLQNRLQRP